MSSQTHNLEKILHHFRASIRAWHRRTHYQYQKEIAEAILKAALQSQSQDAEEGATAEIPIELPRQSGKTTGVVDAVEFILAASRRLFGRPFRIGIFAPTIEQATTDFERLKDQLGTIAPLGFRSRVKVEGDLKIPEKWNSKAIRLYDTNNRFLGEVYIFPLHTTAKPESKTLDLIIIEEAQDINDERMKNAVFPMGASTNAPRIYIGTAGVRVCYFKRQRDSNPKRILITLKEVFEQRRRAARLTGDLSHLLYERYVNAEITREGLQSDYVQRQYFNKWIIGAGQFCTGEQLDAMTGEHGIIESNPEKYPVYVGIDTAKSPDQTVVTLIRSNPKVGKTELMAWLALRGDNYEDQFEYIAEFLKAYEGIRGISIDATGQGDFMPDKFERHTRYNVRRVKFTAEKKDIMYKILLQTIQNRLTLLPKLPPDHENYRDFRQQLLDLQKEYKGRFLSCHHPKEGDAHDDYPDSWALAEYERVESEKTSPGLSFI